MERRQSSTPVNVACSADAFLVLGEWWIVIVVDGVHVVARCGDLVAGYRLSRYQRISNIFGDPWSHIAILVVADGVPTTLEVGPQGVFTRTLVEFAEAYERICIAHLDVSKKMRSVIVASALRRRDESSVRYSSLYCVVIGASGLLRWMVPRIAEGSIERITLVAATAASGVLGDRSAQCAGFIAQTLDEALPNWREPAWPVRQAGRGSTNTWRSPRATREERATRRRRTVNALTSPSDLVDIVVCRAQSLIRPGVVEVFGPDDVHRNQRRRRVNANHMVEETTVDAQARQASWA